LPILEKKIRSSETAVNCSMQAYRRITESQPLPDDDNSTSRIGDRRQQLNGSGSLPPPRTAALYSIRNEKHKPMTLTLERSGRMICSLVIFIGNDWPLHLHLHAFVSRRIRAHSRRRSRRFRTKHREAKRYANTGDNKK
jgi:hypothetical protein